MDLTLKLDAPDPSECEVHSGNDVGLRAYLTQVLLGGSEQESLGMQFRVHRKKGTGTFSINWTQPTGDDEGSRIRVNVSSDNVVPVESGQGVVTTLPFELGTVSDGGKVSVRRSPTTGDGLGNDEMRCDYVGTGDADHLLITIDRNTG